MSNNRKEEEEMRERMAPGRVFVIGLDGATFDLLEPWMEEGRLPHLRRVMEGSTYGRLESTVPPISPPAWASFMTGVNPGKHGIYDFISSKPDSFQKVLVNSSNVRSRRVWDLVGENGKKSIILYVPLTYPPQKIDGVMISGIPAPPNGEFIYPKGMDKELEEKLGEWWVEIEGETFRNFHEETFLRAIYQTLETRLRVADYLMTKEWDLFVLVFMETDLAQHFLWKEKDRCLLPLYVRIDEMIGHLTESLGDEDVVVILSDHGFGPVRKTLYLNTWLRENGFLASKSQRLRPKETADPEVFHRRRRRTLRQMIRWALGRKRFVIDWKKTQCYFINTGMQFHGIRLNLEGREAEGTVKPEEYDRVRNRLIEKLQGMEDKEEGKKVVEAVFRREEIYWGPCTKDAPDVIFVPDYEYAPSERIKDDVFKERRDGRGVHRRDGVLMLRGPGIKKGEKIEGAHIMDLAPTILYLMGLPIPRGFDGKVLTKALEPKILETHPVRYEDCPLEVEAPGFKMTDVEEEEVRKKLRGLGYIE